MIKRTAAAVLRANVGLAWEKSLDADRLQQLDQRTSVLLANRVASGFSFFSLVCPKAGRRAHTHLTICQASMLMKARWHSIFCTI